MPCRGPDAEEVALANTHGALFKLVLDFNEMMTNEGHFLFEKTFIDNCRTKYESTLQAYAYTSFFHECTAVLCDVLGNLSDETMGRYVYDARRPVSAKMAVWWYEHQERDAVRRRRAAEDSRRNRAKKAANAAYDAVMAEGFADD